MHAFLSNVANRQTDTQTNKPGQKHLPPPLSEVKNCCFITMCKAHREETHIIHNIKQQKDVHHLKGRGYNKHVVLGPISTALDVMKIFYFYFLLFYMCHFSMGLTRCYKTTVYFLHLLNTNYTVYLVSAVGDDANKFDHCTTDRQSAAEQFVSLNLVRHAVTLTF